MSDSTYSSFSGATLSAQAWDAFVERHPLGHVLQTTAWGQLKSRVGWDYRRVAIGSSESQLVAGALILFRRHALYDKVPGIPTVAYVPKGPLVNWEDTAAVTALLAALRRVCTQHQAALLKIEPDLSDEPHHHQWLSRAGFIPSTQTIQPQSTIIIDISGSDEEILAQMKPKWRYNIRLATRKDVQVRCGGPEDYHIFQQLIQRTGQRNQFGVRSPDYYTAAFELFCERGLATLLIAEHAGKPLAAIVPFAFASKAYYMWGASSDAERQRMPNHALQWAAMQWAREKGARTYDLWGIPDEVGQNPAAYASTDSAVDEQTGLWGVFRFKQGFGGQVVRYVGAWDLPISRVGYYLYRLALRVRGIG